MGLMDINLGMKPIKYGFWSKWTYPKHISSFFRVSMYDYLPKKSRFGFWVSKKPKIQVLGILGVNGWLKAALTCFYEAFQKSIKISNLEYFFPFIKNAEDLKD